jgi:hypothetical protein
MQVEDVRDGDADRFVVLYADAASASALAVK